MYLPRMSTVKRAARASAPIAVLLSLAACETQPDFEIARLRVDAGPTNVSGSATNPVFRMGWGVEFMIRNNGGQKGLGPDANGVPHAPIPILFTASIPNSNLNGCPMQTTNDVTVVPGPTHHTLLAWRSVPVNAGPIFSFSNVFITDADPPMVCVAEQMKVDFDASQPDFLSTVDEQIETNNGLIVRMVNWPTQKTWVEENF